MRRAVAPVLVLSAHWDHSAALDGKRVAVLGTGASAIQFVPAIAPDAGRLTIFQRSAPWVIPKLDRAYPERVRRLHARVPALPRLWRRGWTAVKEVTGDAVVTADGTRHPADAIVFGTGFAATEFLTPMQVAGCDGRSLSDAWARGAEAYYGLAVPEFPNLFLLYGPNTNHGVGSVIYTHEAQARLAGTAWATCANWYRNADGRITNNWPGTNTEYAQRIRELAVADYVTEASRPASARAD